MTSNIYLITNLVNNKKYVGQTINIKQRWERHKTDYKIRKDRYLYRAMNKYGIDNFLFEVIEKDIPIDSVSVREIFWIDKLSTKAPNGYNMTNGGEGSFGRKMTSITKAKIKKAKENFKHTPESKTKMSSSQKERFKDENARKYMSEKTKGVPKNSENYKKAWENKSEEEKQNQLSGIREARKISVIMCDLNDNSPIKEFDSVRDAARWIRDNSNYDKAGHQNISKACKGKINYVYGYKWIYKQEGVTTIPNGSKVEDELPLEVLSIS